MFSRKFIIRSIAFVGLYVAAASYIYKNEEHFFYKHEIISSEKLYSYDVAFQEMDIEINQEIHLHALLFQHKKPKGLVLFFPKGDYLPLSFRAQDNFFYQQGYSLLIPDYRGTGKSNSLYTNEEDIYSDAQQWYKMANRLSDSLNLLVYGDEFGTGAAAWIGGEDDVDLVILENPYFSWKEIMLKKYFWWLPHSYLSQYQIPVWEFIRKSSNQIILIHATNSEYIKYENSQRLLEFLKPGDELITLDANDIDANSQLYQQKMEKVLIQLQHP